MQQYTIHDLFPGVEGRMEFVRVMLYLKMPQLREIERDQPIPGDLAAKLLDARKAVRNG
jgi:hypothetical protein